MMPFHLLVLAVAFALAACTSGDDGSVETDPVVTDTGDPCAGGERSTFIALHPNKMCEYFEGCPMDDYPFESRAECLSYVRTIWGQSTRWSECLAAECARWLATDPVCTSDIGAPDPSCDNMVKEDDP